MKWQMKQMKQMDGEYIAWYQVHVMYSYVGRQACSLSIMQLRDIHTLHYRYM